MYRFDLALEVQSPCPTPGTDLYGTDTDQSIGNIVTACPNTHNSIDLLAVCTNKHVENGDVFLDKNRQQKLTPKPLPYAITNNQEV